MLCGQLAWGFWEFGKNEINLSADSGEFGKNKINFVS